MKALSALLKLLRYFKEIEHPIVFGIIHILTTIGLRNEEFCKLQVKDLQYDSITGRYFLDVIGKGYKRRQIPLRDKTFNSIIQFRRARGLLDITEADPNKPLFTNTGKAYLPSYLSQYLTNAIEKNRVTIFKKTFIAYLSSPAKT